MEADAKAYKELNKPQYDAGRKFINDLNVPQAAKVLDMGCGTGELTKYITDIAGPHGQVVGVDPDAARIKIADEKYKGVSNLQFHVGNSATEFPHENEPYYDLHITIHAFHWLPADQKKLYLQKTHHSLKHGGKLAILTVCSDGIKGSHGINDLQPLSEDELRKLFQEVGLFPDVVLKKVNYEFHFESLDIFKRWVKASTHENHGESDPAAAKEAMGDLATFHEDGSLTLKLPCISITANKE